MNRLWPLPTLLGLILLAGCIPQNRLVEHQQLITQQARELDSLRIAHREIWRQYGLLEDSLQFIDDIDSGQYYRNMNSLRDRIDRLVYDLSVARDGGLTVEVLASDELFKPTTVELTEKGAEQLNEVVERLQEKYAGQMIRVEGHSDSVPVGSAMKEKYPSNWELAAARAAAVVRYLIDDGGMKPEQFHVASYGAARPAASNESAEGRRENRRIRIAVLPDIEPEEDVSDSASKQ
jgi:chemotaxis protein MotB